jgi:predicted HNH restriction endonuclease
MIETSSGSDGDSNLITLCAGCHAQLHASRSENIGEGNERNHKHMR